MTVAKRRSSTDDKVEAKRKIIRRSLDEITAEVVSELRKADLRAEVSMRGAGCRPRDANLSALCKVLKLPIRATRRWRLDRLIGAATVFRLSTHDTKLAATGTSSLYHHSFDKNLLPFVLASKENSHIKV